jgi:hypothetical protein
MANNPTKEQIKKFWEWYGFKFHRNPNDVANHWCKPNGDFFGFKPPKIDLNNLFRYVPASGRISPALWRLIISRWADKLTGDYKKDTLVLFWAISKIMEE